MRWRKNLPLRSDQLKRRHILLEIRYANLWWTIRSRDIDWHEGNEKFDDVFLFVLILKKKLKEKTPSKRTVFFICLHFFCEQKYILHLSRLILVDSLSFTSDKNFHSTMWLEETISVCYNRHQRSKLTIVRFFFLALWNHSRIGQRCICYCSWSTTEKRWISCSL